MKKIYVATKARGFLINLFNSEYSNLQFDYKVNTFYETNSKLKLVFSKLIKSQLADYLGLIQRIRVKNDSHNMAFSYNKFLKSKKKYVIYLENPLALVHYSTNRSNSLISRWKLKKYFNDPHLTAIICLSKACYETVGNFYKIPERVRVYQIYPYVEDNKANDIESINEKYHKEDIYCLYISSNFSLKGGKDILKTFSKLRDLSINNIKLSIITKIDSIDSSTMEMIKENSNIKLYDFNFKKEELKRFYENSSIYLNPTRQDSFSLVTLEAMKSGNAILTTDLYALTEMVTENFNGFLTNPKYRFFDYNNMPNKDVWNSRENTIYADYIDENIVEFLLSKILYLNNNRQELDRLGTNSYKKSREGKFNQEYIKNEWEKIFSISDSNAYEK